MLICNAALLYAVSTKFWNSQLQTLNIRQRHCFQRNLLPPLNRLGRLNSVCYDAVVTLGTIISRFASVAQCIQNEEKVIE